MKPLSSLGFSLVEMAVAVLVLGMLLAFSIPAFNSISSTYSLKGASENVATQLRLAREKAISVGTDQRLHFAYNNLACDYHVHQTDGTIGAKWKLPKGITYQLGEGAFVLMKKDGRASASETIVLTDARGNQDTISVLLSGLVLTK